MRGNVYRKYTPAGSQEYNKNPTGIQVTLPYSLQGQAGLISTWNV